MIGLAGGFRKELSDRRLDGVPVYICFSMRGNALFVLGIVQKWKSKFVENPFFDLTMPEKVVDKVFSEEAQAS